MATDPAFNTILDDTSLKLLGEICVIQGQIEIAMVSTVRHLLNVPMGLARQLMGSTNVENNAIIWRGTIQAKCQRKPDLIRIADAQGPSAPGGP
jgi:hypothetical protein